MVLNMVVQIISAFFNAFFHTLVILLKTIEAFATCIKMVIASMDVMLVKFKMFAGMLFDEFHIFLNDIHQIVTRVIVSSVNVGSKLNITSRVDNFFDYIQSTLKHILSAQDQFTTAQFANIVDVLVIALDSVKQTVIFVGSGVWFLVMLVPNLIINIIDIVWILVWSLYTNVLDFSIGLPRRLVGIGVMFIRDIPVQAALGIFASYVIWKKRKSLYKILLWCVAVIVEKGCKFYETMKRLNERRLERGNANNEELRISNTDNDRLCSVCLDAAKCVVLFPCRHLCVCKTCAMHVGIQCPVCRKLIMDKVPVYL